MSFQRFETPYYRMCSLTIECVPLLQNVISYHTTECDLLSYAISYHTQMGEDRERQVAAHRETRKLFVAISRQIETGNLNPKP